MRLLREGAKKNEEVAELTYWYGIDASQLTEEKRLGLKLNLGRCQAQDRIFQGRFDPTDFEGVYELYKLAYDDEDAAQKAATEAAMRLVRQETRRGGDGLR